MGACGCVPHKLISESLGILLPLASLGNFVWAVSNNGWLPKIWNLPLWMKNVKS